MSTLEALDVELESTTRALLGDTITYTPAGGSALTPFDAFVDYGESADRRGGSRIIQDDMSVEVPVSIIAEVDKADVIELPKRPGKRYQPRDWLRDETGDAWVIALKEKPE
jgi:hypothetical protein